MACPKCGFEPATGPSCPRCGVILAKLGQFAVAIEHYRKAIDIKPNDAGAHSNLGLALANSDRLDEAIAEYRKALKINPDCVEAMGSLAVAYAEASRLPEALAAVREALKLATRQKNRALVDALRARLAEYEGGKSAAEAPTAPAPPQSRQ